MDFPPRPSASNPRRVERRRTSEPGRSEDAEAGTGAFDWTGELLREEAQGRTSQEPPDHPRRRAPEPERHRPRRRLGSETLARVLWAVPWIVFAIAVIAAGGPIFAAAMVLIGWALLTEFHRMTARARPFQLVAYATVAAMAAAAYLGDSFQILLVVVTFFPIVLGFAIARPSLHNVTWSIAVTVFGIVWIGVPLAHAVLLREIPDHGGALLVDVLVCTFFTDTFAYIGGRMFGRHPLAPTVSPNKTIEGLAIGIAGGVLGFWLAGLYQDWLSGPEALLMGLCIALIAPLGDLFESAIKRDLDVKDTGRMLGPHGGLLDRLDAVLFTVVAGYYLALAIVV